MLGAVEYGLELLQVSASLLGHMSGLYGGQAPGRQGLRGEVLQGALLCPQMLTSGTGADQEQLPSLVISPVPHLLGRAYPGPL